MRIVIPVKPLAQAKSRLSQVLSANERAALSIELFDRVIAAATAVSGVSVVTSDDHVARRAAASGADVITERQAAGLNAAASLSAAHLRSIGESAMLFLAGDLPQATPLAISSMIAEWRDGSAVIAPSGDGGVNALALSTRAPFCFSYGPGSFATHRLEAERRGLVALVHHCASLRFDIDRPEDLARYRVLQAA